MPISLLVAAVVTAVCAPQDELRVQSQMAGEVTATSVILQARLTTAGADGGASGTGLAADGYFEIWTEASSRRPGSTAVTRATAENDHFIKVVASGLAPGERYNYRLVVKTDAGEQRGSIGTFRTLAPDSTEPVTFAVVTGMNFDHFHLGRLGRAKTAYQGDDKALGYPALASILRLRPDYFIGTGDNVYYDRLARRTARTRDAMRAKWHEQFAQPRFGELFAQVPTYWEKDDHDYRLNDSDPTGDSRPSHADGVAVFREQVPVVDPTDEGARTYRTHRLTKHAQIWLLEGRDFRSANAAADGPGKTLWGAEQLEWLRRSLKSSDAAFKIIVTPTPMVGPDDAYKRDNHVNQKGFRYEGDAFFAWLGEAEIDGVFLVCGDRHWQYHSVHPSGVEEFSCGALVDANARIGRLPGDPKSTDPEATIVQPYVQKRASGGFLLVTVAERDGRPVVRFAFHDEHGVGQYEVVRTAR